MGLFRKKLPIEGVALGVLKGLPHIAKHFCEANNASSTPIQVEESALAAAIPAMWLFFLCGKLVGRGESALLHRAFQATWELIPGHGIDVSEARKWFEVFNATLLLPQTDDRIQMVASAFARELGKPELGGAGSPVWLLAYLVSTNLTTMDRFRIV